MFGTILIIIAGIFAAIILAGFFIPSKYSFSKSILIKADKKTVYNYIDDLNDWQKWSAWSKENDPKIVITFGDRREGKGAKMFWKGSKMGRGEIEINESDPYKELQMSAVFNKGVFKMDFRFLVEEDKGQLKVSWIVSGRTRRGGFAKILGRILPKWMGKDIETSLKILKHLSEDTLG